MTSFQNIGKRFLFMITTFHYRLKNRLSLVSLYFKLKLKDECRLKVLAKLLL
jgi:hypothetical protein